MALKSILYLFLFFLGVLAAFKQPIWGAVTFVLMTFIRPEKVTYGQLVPLHLPFLISLILILLFIIKFQSLRKLRYEKTYFFVYLIFITAAYLSSLDAVFDASYSIKYATELFKIFVFSFIMAKFINNINDINRVLTSIMIGASFLAIWGVEQYFRGNVRLENVGGGNYNESNGLAALYVQVLFLFVSLFFVAKNFRRSLLIRVSTFTIAIVYIAGIMFSESRAAFLGLIAGTGNYMIRKKKIKYLVTFALIGLFFYYVASTIPGYLDRIDPDNMAEDKGADRPLIWDAAYRIFLEHPILGVGQQNFRFIAKYYIKGETHRNKDSLFDAHNTFILFMVEGGIIQLGSFILMIFCFYFTTGWLFKHKEYFRNEVLLERIYGIESGMTALLITNFFHSQSISENLYWFLLIPFIIRTMVVDDKLNEVQIEKK